MTRAPNIFNGRRRNEFNGVMVPEEEMNAAVARLIVLVNAVPADHRQDVIDGIVVQLQQRINHPAPAPAPR